jgi:uncharacterized membrane protein
MAKKTQNNSNLDITIINNKTFADLFSEIYQEHASTGGEINNLIEIGIKELNDENTNAQMIMQLIPNMNQLMNTKIKNQESMNKLVATIHRVVMNSKEEIEQDKDFGDIKDMIEKRMSNMNNNQIGIA